jgi:hypothetical protein
MLAELSVDGGFIREVGTFEELVSALRDRRVGLDLTQNELDQVTGLTSGYTSHIERPGAYHGRRIGNVSLPLYLQGLGLKLLVVEDPAGPPRLAESVKVGERRKGPMGQVSAPSISPDGRPRTPIKRTGVTSTGASRS